MKLQKGKILINNIDELDKTSVDKDDINEVIDLAYMGQFEYEGNTIPVSRMFIEYNKDNYCFYPTQIFDKDGKQMYVYINSDLVNKELVTNPNFISDLANFDINKNISLWNYIYNDLENCPYNFWWNVEGNYFIIFGEEKKNIINLFIDECYQRDGGQEEIKRKLLTIGYKI